MRRALLIVTAAALGALATAPQAGADGGDAGEPTHIDDGAARTNPVDASLLPPGWGQGVAAGGKAVEALRADGTNGFRPFNQRAFAYGAYRIQLVSSGSDGNIELARSAATLAAAQLTEITHMTFSVDAGQTPRPTVVNRFPGGFCGSFGGHRCSLFADGDTSVGVIRVGFSSGSPCGALVPSGTTSGTVGCGGPESVRTPSGDVFNVRGNVWLSPSVADANLDIATDVVAHEIGHALGLDHYSPTFTAIPGGTPVRQLMFPSVHSDPSDSGLRYRTGDANGIWWLQTPEAWFITATYRDFLGRIPDTAGYHFWVEADVTKAEYVDSLATSDEWIGRILTDFYTDVFGRAPDPGGFAYWSSIMRTQGVPFVAAQLYGSDEYLRVQGGSTTGFVQGLYRQLLGRDAAADPAGLQFWVSEAARRGRVSVAFDFFQSEEKRRGRVRDLYCSLLDRPPDPGGSTFWAGVILTDGDLALARNLATSDEYQIMSDEFALQPFNAQPAC